MTYKTHREFSIWFGLILNILIYKLGLSNTNYYLNMAVILLFSRQGALFPDIDHEWQNVKEKTVLNRAINFIIHATGGKHRSWQTHSLDIWLCSLIASLYLANTLSFEDRAVLLLIIAGFFGGWFSHLFSDMLSSDGIRLFCFNSKLKLRLVPKKANLSVNMTATLLIIAIVETYYRLHLPNGDLVRSVGIAVGVVFGYTALKLGNMKFNTGLTYTGSGDNKNAKPTWEDIVYKFTLRVNLVVFILSVVYPYWQVV